MNIKDNKQFGDINIKQASGIKQKLLGGLAGTMLMAGSVGGISAQELSKINVTKDIQNLEQQWHKYIDDRAGDNIRLKEVNRLQGVFLWQFPFEFTSPKTNEKYKLEDVTKIKDINKNGYLDLEDCLILHFDEQINKAPGSKECFENMFADAPYASGYDRPEYDEKGLSDFYDNTIAKMKEEGVYKEWCQSRWRDDYTDKVLAGKLVNDKDTPISVVKGIKEKYQQDFPNEKGIINAANKRLGGPAPVR